MGTAIGACFIADVGFGAIEARAETLPTVNVSGVFNTKGLSCPEHECERCPPPLNTAPFHAPVNFTGIDVVACRYRAEVCEAIRTEIKLCKRHARALCTETDTRVKAKAKCRREVNRIWKTRCKEQRVVMVSRVETIMKRFDEVRSKIMMTRETRQDGGLGNDLTMLETELARLKTGIGHAFDEVRDNAGGVAVGRMSDKLEQFVHGPSTLDTVSDMQLVLESMSSGREELDGLLSAARRLCSYEASLSTSDGKVMCEDMEEKAKLSEKRINKCAARVSDYLTSTAKIDALIVEKNRRFQLLESLDRFMTSFNGAWLASEYDFADEFDDEFPEEPSTRFNLTEHVTTGIINSLMDHYTTASARRALATAEVDESALCAQIIPRFQLSLLGSGFKRGDLVCPPPHGTFIAGRELPDWSAYFLFLFGVGIGVAVAVATNQAQQAVDFVQANGSIVAAVAVVVLAGRFF